MMPNDKATMFNKIYNQFVENSLLSFQEQRLAVEYPVFADLLKEYMDGILLYELTDQKVWSKAVNDNSGLMNFYTNNKIKYGTGSFDELKGNVVEGYKEYLEIEWIKSLRIRYPVTINEQVLLSIIKK